MQVAASNQFMQTFKYDTGFQAFSFLCTFVPGSEKAIERTFAPVELSFHGTFAPEERKVLVLSFHGTFAPVEPSLHKQLSCPITFAPVLKTVQCWAGTKVPQERKFQERMFHGTKVPRERKFSLWPFRSRERKCRGTKRPGIPCRT